MSSVTQPDANATLRRILVGASATGVRFGSLQLLFASPHEPGEVFINLLSAFHVFGSRPADFPLNEADIPDESEEDELLSLFALRFAVVEDAEMVEPFGHLAVTFSGGAILYVNGNNPGPEPWHVGLNALDRSKSVQIIAISGSHPVVFSPFAA